MENFRFIEYQHARDFSMKMNATFEFIKQNFKSLGRSILYIAGPPALIGGLIMSSFMGEYMKMITSGGVGNPETMTNYFLSVSFWLQVILGMIFGLLSFVSTVATIYNYMLLYEEKRSNQIEVSEVWSRVRDTFWMYFGTSIFFGLLFVIAYIALIIPMVLLAAISPWLIVFGIIGLIVGLLYLLFGSSLTFVIRGYERKGFFESLMRSFYLVRGKWWSTFGLVFLLTLIVGTVSYIFLIPYYIIIFTSALHSVSPDSFAEPSSTSVLMSTVFFALYYLAQVFLYTLPNVGIAFQYFNLVELKEAKGLMRQIEDIGQTNSAQRPEEHY